MQNNAKSRTGSRPTAVSLAAAAVLSSGASLAQDADTDGALTEVVVTAQKRSESINNVGMTIQAVSGEMLREQQVSSLQDIANIVPGLSYADTQSGTPVYTLRGVGFYDTSLGAYPTVSVYLDQVPLSFPVLTRHSAFDLEQIEVLKGPQGTLFGENATGGAINYIAATPTRELSTGIDVSTGSYGETNVEGFLSGPVADGLTGRIAVRTESGDGWQQSVTRPEDRNGAIRNVMARLLLNYRNDVLQLSLDVNGWIDQSQTQALQDIALFPTYPVTPAGGRAFAYALPPQTPNAADWVPGIPYADNRMWQVSLRADYFLPDGITVTSLSAYTDYHQHQGAPGEGLPIETLSIEADLGMIDSVFQELRMASSDQSRFRWTVGANYEHSTIDQAAHINYSDSFANEYLSTLGFPISENTYSTYESRTNFAGFADGDWNLGSVVLKSGVRYTENRTSASICNRDPIGAAGGTGSFFFDALLGGAYGPYVANECYALNKYPNGAPVVSYLPAGGPGQFEGTLNESNTSWREGLDWRLSPQELLYLNVNRGYKAGGFPTTSASTFAQYLPVKQESVTAYESGLKSQLWQGRVQLDAAGYYYDYRDKQLRSKVIDPVFGLLDLVQNIPRSRVYGAELSVLARATSHLKASLALAYTDATITQFTGINAAGVTANFAGSAVPFAPKYQSNVDAEYRAPITAAVDVFLGGDVNYRSSTVSVVGGDVNPAGAIPDTGELFGIKAYTLVGLRAGVASSDDIWRVQLWGNNILNTYYWNNVVSLADVISRYTGMGATYGISFSYRYHQ